MGHIRLGRLPATRKWRDVVALLEGGNSTEEIARASADAAEKALAAAIADPAFVQSLRYLTFLPLLARTPGFPEALESSGLGRDASQSLPSMIAAISRMMDSSARSIGGRSDFGEIAQMALVESLTDAIAPQLPSLFEPEPAEFRRALGRLSSGDHFAALARSFFARLTYRTLDYWLSRELSNHVGPGRRFQTDADRVAFDHALAQHAFESAGIVEAYAGGWYGKHVWKGEGLSEANIANFARYAFKKIRDELGQRRQAA